MRPRSDRPALPGRAASKVPRLCTTLRTTLCAALSAALCTALLPTSEAAAQALSAPQATAGLTTARTTARATELKSAPKTAPVRALALAAAAAPAASAADQLLNFAEGRFPAFFPQRQPTQVLAPFLYRHYPATGIYLGVVVTAGLGYTLNGVYVMGGSFGPSPLYVGLLTDFIQPVSGQAISISPGWEHTLAARSDGAVLVLGNGMEGGPGTPLAGSVARVVSGLRNIVQVQAAQRHTGFSLALDSSGVVWGWGYNPNGALGSYQGSAGLQVDPKPIAELGAVKQVTQCGTGENARVFGLRADGTLWYTPGRRQGGTVTASQVAGLPAISSLADHRNELCSNALALGVDGSAWKLDVSTGASGAVNTFNVTASRLGNLPAVTQASCGAAHCVALGVDGAAWTWGSNGNGELGDGSFGGGRTLPYRVPGLPSLIKVAAGELDHTLALAANGALYGWGQYASTAGFDASATPVLIRGSGVIDIASGALSFTQAFVLNDGTLWGWGGNFGGQLGDGSQGPNRYPPVQALGVKLF